ncbi:MAG TPA: acyl-CoA dehydrogenase [Gammaproteobacteria bacterium]|nr:acyl-CoA dehydrogenase [Gammaproteobacteria bacterium]
MRILFEVLIFVAAGWGLAALRAPGWAWSALAATGLVLLPSVHEFSAWWLSPFWLAWAALSTAALVAPLRRRLLTGPALRALHQRMPPISDTEREALEAGSTWWEAELFSGRPDWKRLLELGEAQLSEQEQAFLDGPVETLCNMLDDWEITEHLHDLPPAVWDYLKRERFFGMIIPRRYGGLEFSAHAHSCVVMKIASRSITAAVTTMVPNSLGPAQLLLNYGTEQQKDYYLPRLARGEEIPCFALTGPEAGSDAASMPDRGLVCRQMFQGRETLGIRLNWEKRYITLGPVATVLGLAFKLQDPDHLLGETEELGITLALIPTDTPGVEIGARHFPLNQAFMNGPNRGHDVFIPMDWVIGGQARVGQGWRMLMECLADGRAISLPALSTGAGKLAARATGAYAAVRRQFKMPIGRFEGVAEVLGRIAGNAYAMDAARGLTTLAVDRGEKPAVASAIVKYHLTERMRRVIDDAMDIHGGRGICMGPSNYLARVYQAIPISITVEGANILTRSLIIFGQGVIRCHPWLLQEIQAAQRGDTRTFDRALCAHLRLALSNFARALFHGLTGARLARAPVAREEARWYRQLTRLSAAFAVTAEVALATLGGNLKRRESLSARLGDVLSQLYLASAALKRYHDQGRPDADRPLLEWAVRDALARAGQALFDVFDNLPAPVPGTLLKRLLFPLGMPWRAPDDALSQRAARLLLRWGAARERLSEGLFIPHGEHEALAQLELALERATAAEPVLKRLREAMREGQLPDGDPEHRLNEAIEAAIIDAREAAAVREAMAARQRVIAVDEFPGDYWSGDNWKEHKETWQRKPTPSPRAARSTS